MDIHPGNRGRNLGLHPIRSNDVPDDTGSFHGGGGADAFWSLYAKHYYAVRSSSGIPGCFRLCRVRFPLMSFAVCPLVLVLAYLQEYRAY